MSKNIIPQKEFDFISKIDKEYIELFKKNFSACKKTLPHYADFEDYRIMEDREYFNGRLAATSIKPRFITSAMEKHTKERSELYMKILDRLRELLKTSPSIQKYFHLDKNEKEFLKTKHPYKSAVPFACFDGVLTPEKGLQVFEINTNCPAGGFFIDSSYDVIKNFPTVKKIKDKYKVKFYLQWTEKILEGLMENYRAWGGKKSHPNILILRLPGNYNQDSDFYAQGFNQLGHRCIVGDATQVHYKNGKLYYHGTQYDLILRWFDLVKLLEYKPVYHDLLRAYFDNAACIVNPPLSSIFAHKAIFSFFTDERFADNFTKKEKEILGEMCLWTRILEKRKTTLPDGSQGDLITHVLKNKNIFIIKPSNSTYGQNIFIGQKIKKTDWQKVVSRGIREGGWVVQQKVELPKLSEPTVVKNSIVLKDYFHDNRIYMINGKMDKIFGRFSPSLITNAIKGGTVQIGGKVNKK